MIVGSNKENRNEPASIEELISTLRQSTHTFYLTGSRFFTPPDAAKRHADWDFFTTFNGSIYTVEFLRDLGFENHISASNDFGYDLDDLCTSVWRHHFGVDIQFVSDVVCKANAQEILKSMPLEAYQYFVGNKQYAKAWWNWAYTVAKQMK